MNNVIKKIVHGDLKPGNILLKYQYVPNEMHKNRIKISDFGLSLIIKDDNVKIHGGREGYLALEVWKGKGGSFPSDIYSIGKIMCEILSNGLLDSLK